MSNAPFPFESIVPNLKKTMKKQLTVLVLLALLGCQKEKVDAECIEKPANPGCYKLYSPVCGCNGKTYDNDCLAEGNGITRYTKGPCK